MEAAGDRTGLRAADLERLRATLASHRLVNLTGVLGAGKTWLAQKLENAATVDLCRPGGIGELPKLLAAQDPETLIVVDGVDGAARTAAVRTVLDEAERHGRLLLVSRRPLRAAEGWTGGGAATLDLAPVPCAGIEVLAGAAGIGSPDGRALVTRMSGGVPLIAEAVCRALHTGAAPDAPGAVADRVAGEMLDRLDRELPGGRWRHALRLLATVGSGDEQLLAGGPDLFTRLGELSLVTRGALGLTVREPFRTILETAYRWRRPLAHHTVRSRAAAYRHTLLARATEPAERVRLAEQRLFLTGDPVLRSALIPAADSTARVAPARPEDADDISRLMRRWALRSDFDPRRAERIADRWMGHEISAFHLARDPEGQPVGLAGLLPVSERTADGMEPLLQQHTERLTAGPRPGGLFLGAAYCAEPATHARLLRHILGCAVRSGHLIVSTASPEYQVLVRGLGFRPHGSIRDDVFRCGRRPEVYTNDFTPAALPAWLGRLDPAVGAAPVTDAVAEVARALSRIRDPRALADSRLLALPATPTVPDLQAWLHDAVLELAVSDELADAEAGTILQAYYLGRASTHHQVACRLHLSRATYFRRLRRGLEAVAERLPQPDA
ncbi:hypothetical protein [Streptomyces sp. NPDC058572]|uniref:hypothetical protein n=1 Tax=Streptomyces sp. NPDC058572 TaxID=3346546 RepID=UPI003667432A